MAQIHAIPGRLRVRSAALKRDPGSATALKTMIEAMGGVKSVEVRPVTGSIIVRYSLHAISADTILQTLAAWGFLADSSGATSKAEPGSGATSTNRNSGVAQSLATVVVNRTLEKAVEKLVERSVIKLIACLL